MRRARFSPLRGHWIDHRSFVLDEEFRYRSTYGEITVPAGFVTDFDSVPRLPLAFWLTKGRSRLAPVIHDWLYSEQRIGPISVSRGLADRIFLEAMEDEGVGRAARFTIWAGVRAWGWLPWRRHGRCVEQRA